MPRSDRIAARLILLILASVLSAYAALWFFEQVSMGALLLRSGLFAFVIAILMLFCGIASLSGIAQGWRRRNRKDAPGEALLGFLLMLAFLLFQWLMGVVS